MEIPLLKDILTILGLGVVVLLVFSRLKIPPIVGFLLTGVLAGPYGLSLVKAVHEVEVMAEIGVILLLFSLGLEFSFSRLMELKRAVFISGTTQVLLTTLIATGLAFAFNQPLPNAIFIGFLVSLSSTAIVLKILQERANVDSPYGRTSVGILIFQDVIIVPMMLVTPLLAGGADSLSVSPFDLIYKILFLIILVFVSQKWLVPFILFQITRTRNRELFLMAVAFIAFSIAWLTAQLGLSLGLGAFLAGLIISESEYSQNALAHILPFRDIFMAFFFVSVGMLLKFSTILDSPVFILILCLVIIIIKILTAGAATALLGYPFRIVLSVALALAQIGEFSFVLSKVGLSYELISQQDYQVFLAVSVLTMILTPFLFLPEQRVGKLTRFFRIPEPVEGELKSAEFDKKSLTNHLIIIGYGLNGQNLSRAAQKINVPYVVLDLNPNTVREEQKKGIPIFFGDATHEEVLTKAGIERARILVLAINDAAATRRITHVAHQLNQYVHVIVRTRYIKEVQPLFSLGADEVIPEEFETSVEIFNRVLRKFMVSESEIEDMIDQIRADCYEVLRKSTSEDEGSLFDSKIEPRNYKG